MIKVRTSLNTLSCTRGKLECTGHLRYCVGTSTYQEYCDWSLDTDHIGVLYRPIKIITQLSGISRVVAKCPVFVGKLSGWTCRYRLVNPRTPNSSAVLISSSTGRSSKHPYDKNLVSSISTGVPLKISQPSLRHSTKPIFLRFIVFFTVHLLKVSNGETETELFWGSWVDQPVAIPNPILLEAPEENSKQSNPLQWHAIKLELQFVFMLYHHCTLQQI